MTTKENDVFDALKYRIEVDQYGTVFYFNKDGSVHRENGPAIITAQGTRKWVLNGKFHREDGPAIIYSDGVKAWYLYGRDYDEDDFLQALAELGLGPTDKRTA